MTDGEDDPNCGPAGADCSRTAIVVPRAEACSVRQGAGHRNLHRLRHDSRLYVDRRYRGRKLRECSSAADNPDGNYVFLNDGTPESLEAAFADIARQLRILRKVS